MKHLYGFPWFLDGEFGIDLTWGTIVGKYCFSASKTGQFVNPFNSHQYDYLVPY